MVADLSDYNSGASEFGLSTVSGGLTTMITSDLVSGTDINFLPVTITAGAVSGGSVAASTTATGSSSASATGPSRTSGSASGTASATVAQQTGNGAGRAYGLGLGLLALPAVLLL